LVPLEAEFFIE